MPEPREQDLRKLFRTAGHHHPGEDLTARIMARVAVTPIIRASAPPPPLIGRWGWVAIGSLLAIPLLAALVAGPSATVPLNGLWTSLTDRLGEVRLPEGSWPVWVMGASCAALLLVALDQFLSRNLHQRVGS